MTHRFIILTFLFYCISSFYSYGQLRQIVISGTVIDDDSKKSLPYATVSAFDTEGVLINGGITDENGVFKLKLTQDSYTLKFEYIGFESLTTELKVYNNNKNKITNNESTNHAVVLSPIVIGIPIAIISISVTNKFPVLISNPCFDLTHVFLQSVAK